MALFKIFKGNASDLPSKDSSWGNGYAWFTQDDGKFYIDYYAGDENSDNPLDNDKKIRQPLNADRADAVAWSGITGKPSTFTPSSHTHGNITNAGELTTASRAVVTDANKKITTKDLSVSSATDSNDTATRFVSSVTQDAQGQISVTTKPLPTYNNYSLPLAASGTRGGIQIGYTQSGKNYPVQLSSEKAYVNVPWTDTWKANSSSSEGYVASGSGQANKVWKTDANGNPAWRDDANSGGTVTSVRVQASSPLQSSQNTAQNNTLNTTISFTNQNANKVLAGPSSGSAAAPTFRALVSADIPSSVALTGTPTAPTAAAGTNTTQIATTAFVTSTVQDLAGPMRFIGTLGSGGTITTLPAASNTNKGHTYKVIAKGTYQGIYGEVGDLMISNGTTWVNIPSGDVPDGTVTNVATGSGLTGGPITTTGTISHANTSDQASITANGRKYITGVTLDDFGHVTGLTTGTETVTNTTYTFAEGTTNGAFSVTPSGGSAQSVPIHGLNGAAYKAEDYYVKRSGDTITGNINRYYSETSTDPMITALANNKDILLFEVGHGAQAGAHAGEGSNHYQLKYVGTGVSPNNYLQFIASTGTDDIVALQFNENGNAIFNGATYFNHSNSSDAHPVISGTRDNLHLSIGRTGVQAYNNNTASTLALNYYGGSVNIGSADTATATRDFYGTFDFKTTGGFTYSGIEAAGTANAYRPIWFASATSSTNIIKGKPSYDDNFTYNPVANSLHIVHANGKSQEFRISYSDTVDMSMMIGTGNENHGLYDHIAGKWMIVADSSGNVTVNGNATTATTASKLSNTSKIGDTNKPVYFTANGVPAAISYTIDKSVPANAVFTDEKVTQTITTTDASTGYRLLFSGNANDTTETVGVRKDTDLRWSPSTNTLDIAASNSNGILKTSTGTLTVSAASTMYLSNPNNVSMVFTTDDTTTGEYARFNSKGNLILDNYTSTVNNITHKLYVNGTSYFTNTVTLYAEGTTEADVPVKIAFSNKDTTTGKTYNGAYIYGYQDHGATPYGLNLVINPGGNLFIGGGESPANLYAAIGKGALTENIYITADTTIYLEANANTIANRKGVAISTAGTLYPVAAEAVNNDAQNLGTTNARWQNIYASRSVNVERAGEATIILNNTTTNHKIEVVSGTSGNAGLYDMTKSFYFINTDQTNGDTTVQSYTNRSIYFKQNGTTIAEIKSAGLYVGLTTDTIERDIVARSDLGTISIFQHGSGDAAKSHGIWATSTTSDASAVGLYWLQDNSVLRSSTTIDIVSTPSNRYKYLTFSQSSSPNGLAGFIRYDSGHKTNISAGQFSFHEYSPQSTATTTSTGYKEIYVLPNVTAGLAADATYSILTTKNKVTIAQGGTNATTQAGAFTNIVAPGGQMTGPLSWKDSTALPAATSADFFLTIDAFADGGKTKYITKANAIKTLVSSSSIGSSTKPVYWTGSAFSAIGYTIETSVPSGAVFTDANVTQSSTTTTNWRKVLLSYQNGSSGDAVSSNTNITYASADLEYQPSTGTLKATKFQGPLTGNVTGNATTSTQTYVTVSHPSAVTYYAPTFISRTSTGTTSGNSDLRASDRYYLYDSGSAIWLNVGKANYLGGITFHDNSSYYVGLRSTTLTANRTLYMPNATGWLVAAGNGTSTGAGSSTQPVYVSTAGVATGITTTAIAYGGTGAATALAARTNLGAAPAPLHIYADATVGASTYYYVPLDIAAASSNIWVTGDIWINNYTSTSYITPGRITFSFVWTSSGAFSSGYYTDAGSSLGSFELLASPADETTGNRTLYLKLKHTVKYSRFYITAYSTSTVNKNIALVGTTTAPTIDSGKTFTMTRKGPVFVTGTSSDTKYYLVGVTGANATTGSYHLYKAYNGSGSANTAGVYFNGSSGVLYGAAWNDYAEYRETKEEIKPGCCVKEIGDDTLELTTNRLERGCEIVSDTYGFAIGETNKSKTPIAASGRVLAYPYESREEFAKHIGWPVCSGPNGTVSIMTEEEEEKYPSRIIGTISAVPDYEEWGTGNVKVNGRVWIRIR